MWMREVRGGPVAGPTCTRAWTGRSQVQGREEGCRRLAWPVGALLWPVHAVRLRQPCAHRDTALTATAAQALGNTPAVVEDDEEDDDDEAAAAAATAGLQPGDALAAHMQLVQSLVPAPRWVWCGAGCIGEA